MSFYDQLTWTSCEVWWSWWCRSWVWWWCCSWIKLNFHLRSQDIHNTYSDWDLSFYHVSLQKDSEIYVGIISQLITKLALEFVSHQLSVINNLDQYFLREWHVFIYFWEWRHWSSHSLPQLDVFYLINKRFCIDCCRKIVSSWFSNLGKNWMFMVDSCITNLGYPAKTKKISIFFTEL